MMDRRRAEEAFQDYTARYDASDPLIRAKAEHTLRVAENCRRIAESLDMSPEDVDLAWLLGLLHDIGRFEQVRRYGTLVDSDSVDHAAFGADLLFNDGLIDAFPIESLSPDGLLLLETAIRLHNRLTLPEELLPREKIFCDLIRDADKADIFRVLSELPFEARMGSSRALLHEADGASPEVMACVFQHRCVPRDIRRTRFEGRISHVCMAFELVYPETRRIVREQGDLFRLLNDADPLWTPTERQQLRAAREEIEGVLLQTS